MATEPTRRITFDPAALTDEQRAGVVCVVCGLDYLTCRGAIPSIPAGVVDGGQVFACTDCATPDGQDEQDMDGIDPAESAAALDRLAAKHGVTAEVAAIRAFRAEQDGQDDEGGDDEDARARRTVDNILYLADRGPAVQQLADANRAEGRTGVADALDAVADAHDRLADAVGLDGDVFAAVEDIAVATANAEQAMAAARAAEGTPGGFLIPAPADPVLRAEWEAGAAAREAAGLSGFVGEDYPAEGGRA